MSTNIDWKDVIGAVAPTLGTLLGGPLAGMAIGQLSKVLLGKDDGTEEELSQVVMGGLSNDKIVEIQRINRDTEVKLAQMQLDKFRIETDLEKAYVSDTADARKYKDDNVFTLGVTILLVFAVVMSLSVYGCFQILTGGIELKDASTVGIVAGFLGTVIGYVAANAQQVVSYFFGSSAGSAKKTTEMAESFKAVMRSK